MCVHVIGKNTEQRVEFRTCVSVCACNKQEHEQRVEFRTCVSVCACNRQEHEQRLEFRTCVSVCACNRQEHRAESGVQDMCECVHVISKNTSREWSSGHV